VQQVVTVRMKYLLPERFRNDVLSAVDCRARRRGGQSRDVANVAADFGEQHFASLGCGGRRLLSVARGGFGRAYEACEAINVQKTVCALFVVRFDNAVA